MGALPERSLCHVHEESMSMPRKQMARAHGLLWWLVQHEP
jgi:hypothetical protein